MSGSGCKSPGRLGPVVKLRRPTHPYGFRPGRGQHEALDALAFAIQRKQVNYILDADIKGFFDNLSKSWLVKFVEHRVADRRILRLIQKWLNAGVMEDGKWSNTEIGTPQVRWPRRS